MLYMDIYGNIYHQYTPNVSIYIPAPWIRHGLCCDPPKEISIHDFSSRGIPNPIFRVFKKDYFNGKILFFSAAKLMEYDLYAFMILDELCCALTVMSLE